MFVDSVLWVRANMYWLWAIVPFVLVFVVVRALFR